MAKDLKQIIIDGVDVSGCSYFNCTDEHFCDECSSEFGCAICDERPNCIYKQLKRKEQSEERLVKQIQTICNFINNRPEIFKGIYGGVDKIITEYAERKEQECEELKQRLHQCWTVENSFVVQLDQLEAELKQEKTLKEMYFTYYKAKHGDIKGEFFKLKAENKELSKELERIHEDIKLSPLCYKCDKEECLQKEIDKLKSEKEEIKKYLGISSKTIMERLEELQEFRDNDKDKLYQAEQTLIEIKEIAENVQSFVDINL